jgi:hypothetical protein
VINPPRDQHSGQAPVRQLDRAAIIVQITELCADLESSWGRHRAERQLDERT